MSDTSLRVAALIENEFGLYDLSPQQPIFSAGLLDSMDVLRLIVALEKNFSIKIPAFEVSLETFDTLETIENLLTSKLP
ncbi:MAG: acyl carrier protein [Immundisolibacteraceae bacterium]|nr:acyl carrier protein [Immundisolibacteraceae bacterium]